MLLHQKNKYLWKDKNNDTRHKKPDIYQNIFLHIHISNKIFSENMNSALYEFYVNPLLTKYKGRCGIGNVRKQNYHRVDLHAWRG